MSERTLRAASGALALTGAAVASYLIYVRETGAALACGTGGCETVQSSEYAEIMGVPVAALGLAGFLGLFVAALVPGHLARLTQTALSIAALTFTVYLLFVQLLAIGAVCDWCLLVDALTTALAATALLRLRAGVVTAE